MKKRLVQLIIVVCFLFGGVGDFQKDKLQTQPDVMTPSAKDEYPEIIPGG